MSDSSALPRTGHPRVVLCILDGVGYRTGPGSEVGNAVIGAEPAFYNSLFERYPHTTLEACGQYVGLPEGQMGNSEVGHLTIGAGRVVNQELARIATSITDGEFATIETWRKFIARAKEGTGRLHLLGLVSPGGVHSHTDHLYGIIAEAAKAGLTEIFVHAGGQVICEGSEENAELDTCGLEFLLQDLGVDRPLHLEFPDGDPTGGRHAQDDQHRDRRDQGAGVAAAARLGRGGGFPG